MTDEPTPRNQSDPDERIEEVVLETVGDIPESPTRREALELELEAEGRSEEGADIQIAEVIEDAEEDRL